jgi:hypothetical protein
MFADRTEEEKREWLVFMPFLARKHSFPVDGAARHVEWVLQRPFQNVGEWLSEEGDKWRKIWRMSPLHPELKQAWTAFAAEHAGRTFQEVDAELEKLAA